MILTIIGYISTGITSIGIIVAVVLWFRGILPVLFRLGNGLAKRKPDQEKIQKILKRRGYKNGESPRSWEVRHIIPLAEGGKDIPKNIRVIP